MVLMDDRLYAARDVTKTNSTRVETFQAPERGPIAITDADGLFFHTKSPGRSSPQFDVSALRELPRVEIAFAYAGADSAAVDAFVAAGAKGIVIAGVGRGGASQAMDQAINRAVKKGVVVVMTTRTGSGRVGDNSPTSIGAGDLNAQKARILLMLALTRTSSVPGTAKDLCRESVTSQRFRLIRLSSPAKIHTFASNDERSSSRVHALAADTIGTRLHLRLRAVRLRVSDVPP